MTTNIRFTESGEISGLARAPTIKFKFFGIFLDFPLLDLVIEHSTQRTMTLKRGARVKKLSDTQVERVLSRFLKYRNRQSAESLSEQYFLPLDGVPKLQEAIISRNASHFVFASDTFASEQKSEEFLDVDRFSDFYQSLEIRINQAKSFFQMQSISPLRLKITVMFLPDVAEARLTNLEFRSFVVNIGYYSTTSSILESIQSQVGDYLDSGGRYSNSGYQHNFNPDMLRTDYFQLTFINTPSNQGGSSLQEQFYLKLDNSKKGRRSVYSNGFVNVVDCSEDSSKNDCFFNSLKSALNLPGLNVLKLREKLNIPANSKIDFDNIQVIIDFMDSQGHPCKVEIYAEKPTYKTLFYEASNKVAYIDNHTGVTEVLNCITDIKNVKAQIEDFKYQPIATFSSNSATVESHTIKIVLADEHYMLFYEGKRIKQPFSDFEKFSRDFDEKTGIFLCSQKKKKKLTMAEKREYLTHIGVLNRKRKREENKQVTRKKQRTEKTTAGFVVSFDYETVFIWDGTIKPYWLHYKVSTYSNEMITEDFIVAETKEEIEDNVVTRKFIDFLDKFEEETKQIVSCFRKFQFIACGNSQEDIPKEFMYKQLFNSTTGQFGYFKTELIDEPCETSQQINTFVSRREFKFFPVDNEMYLDIMLKDSKKAYIHDGQKGFLKPYTPQMSRQYDSYKSVFITSEPFEKPLVSCREATKVMHPKKILVAFNGSGFDNFILADVLMQKGYLHKRSLFFAGNKLFGLKFKSYETFDPYRFTFPSSLDACVRDFKLENKKLTEFKANFTTIQLMFQEDRLFEWLKLNHDPMYNYCRQDVLSLHELFFVLRDTFEACTHTFKNHGKFYDSFYTIAGLAKYAWEQGLAKDIMPHAPKTYETWSNCKKAVIGGRAQCFKAGRHEGKFVFLDVKSMYPYVMTNRVFPCGEETPTDTYVRGKCGIYLVDVHFQQLPLIVPRRDPNPQVALDWNFTGAQEGIWLCSVDIEMLWKYYGFDSCTVHTGFYWINDTRTLFNCMLEWKKVKQHQDEVKGTSEYNPALRQISKLLLNSLSGKVSQRIFEKRKVFINDSKHFKQVFNNADFDLTDFQLLEPIFPDMQKGALEKEFEKLDDSWKSKRHSWKYKSLGKIDDYFNPLYLEVKYNPETVYNPKKDSPAYLATFIYAYSRQWMYDKLIYKCPSRIQMDTDSLLVSYEDYKVLLEDPDLQPYLHKKPWQQAEFGDFEDEFWDEFGTEAIKTVFNPGDINDWKQNATESQIDRCYDWIHRNRVSTVYGVRPKVYGIYGPTEAVKTKFKGLSKNAKIIPPTLNIPSTDLFKCFTNKLCEDGNPMHNDAPLLQSVSENHKFKQCIYDDLVAGETLRTLNSQIVKEIGYNQKFCQLRQVYLTKNLTMK